jgi:hypothetical protein
MSWKIGWKTYALIGILAIIVLIMMPKAPEPERNASTVAVNVSDENSSWKVTNAGDTPIDVEIRNGVTGMVIRSLGIGESKSMPKENVEITARQNG